jgi:hypothetical protein
MKISAYHKSLGDIVTLNEPLMPKDLIYASIMFDSTPDPFADIVGGTKYPEEKLPPQIEAMKPDYDLYPEMDYSIGYTYKACPRTCDFCVVPKQRNDENHYSIWSFHNPKFKKITLMNNNTLADLYWRNTFDEIIDAGLTIIDHGGYDARLFTEESADYLKRLKFQGYIHVAWDYVEHEKEVLRGINFLLMAGISKYKILCYVLIGESSHDENIYRTEKLRNIGTLPFVMPLNKKNRYQKDFARWVNHKAIFQSVSWKDYNNTKKERK